MASNKKTPIVCHGHARPIVAIEYSTITPDGFFLASASKDGQPMLRHGDSGDWYGTFTGHKGAVWSCTLNQQALLCATGSADFSARLWDACTGNQLHNWQHNHIVRSTAFSSNSNKLATGGMEKFVRLFDVAKPEAAPDTLPTQASGIRCLTWVQNDNLLLCSLAEHNGIVAIDTRSNQHVRTIETEAPVLSIEASFDGSHITTAEGKVVRFFDMSGPSGSIQQIKEHRLPRANAESASLCPSKRVFAAGGEDMWVRLFNFDTGAELDCNKGHHGPVHAVRFSPTYEAYASGSEDGTIRIWPMPASDGPAQNGK